MTIMLTNPEDINVQKLLFESNHNLVFYHHTQDGCLYMVRAKERLKKIYPQNQSTEVSHASCFSRSWDKDTDCIADYSHKIKKKKKKWYNSSIDHPRNRYNLPVWQFVRYISWQT